MLKIIIAVITVFSFDFSTHVFANNGKPVHLKCEHLTNPIGIDNPTPRFSWRLEDNRQGAIQMAYRIVLDTDSMAVVNNRGEVWDTGKQVNPDMLVSHSGQKLKPLTRYFWKVIAWDKEEKPNASEISVFETGMMGINHFQGAWISDNHDIHYQNAPYFRKEFEVKKPIKYARAYIAVAGLYELSLNGERIGDHRLDPMYTRYDRRTLYVAHDVTAQLQSGANAIGVVLGKKVEETGFHLDVGVLGAKALLNALTNNGYSESAYKVAVQDTYPSWGWWVVNGATTLLENWDLEAERDISDNHMMFGEIGGWFFKSIGGILPDPKAPGFKNIVLKPIFPEELDQSEVKYISPYGEIVSAWKKSGKTVIYDILVPANSTATFHPPENVEDTPLLQLTAGRHQLKLKLK